MASEEKNRTSPVVDLDGVEVNQSLMRDMFLEGCRKGDIELLERLRDGISQETLRLTLHHKSSCVGTPLFEAIAFQRVRVVEFLLGLNVYDLEKECDIDMFFPIFFRDKSTPLCFACACDEIEIVEMLLKHGADVNHPSQHSSPLIYASEFNNAKLIALLLQFGAKVNIVPRGLQTESSILPLFQACLHGHKDTADLLLSNSAPHLPLDKHVTLLGLLGAQLINQKQYYTNGLQSWRDALNLLENAGSETGVDSLLAAASSFSKDGHSMAPGNSLLTLETDLASKLKILYSQEAVGGLDTLSYNSSNRIVESSLAILHDMKLCTSIEELEQLDIKGLSLQALGILERILGPCHPETIQQVTRAAHLAEERGDLSMACKLYLYIIETNEMRHNTSKALEYSSQMACLLLNSWLESGTKLTTIEDIPSILLSALYYVQQGASRACDLLDNPSSSAHTSSCFNSFTMQRKQQSKVKLLSEMCETFMAYLLMLVELQLEGKNFTTLCRIVSMFMALGSHKSAAKFNVEVEVFRLATYEGQTSSSTLYFYELFPNLQALELLVRCGGNINCRDNLSGDTPLHFCLDCPKPSRDILQLLLDHGAHVDIFNNYGITASNLLSRQSFLRINPFNYTSLKCLAARVIVDCDVPYIGQVPRSMESFIPWHGLARTTKESPTLNFWKS